MGSDRVQDRALIAMAFPPTCELFRWLEPEWKMWDDVNKRGSPVLFERKQRRGHCAFCPQVGVRAILITQLRRARLEISVAGQSRTCDSASSCRVAARPFHIPQQEPSSQIELIFRKQILANAWHTDAILSRGHVECNYNRVFHQTSANAK